MSQVRDAATRAGRDPDELDIILRVNTVSGDSVDSIVDVLQRAHDVAAVDHAFVDLTYRDRAKSVSHAVDLAGRVLGALRDHAGLLPPQQSRDQEPDQPTRVVAVVVIGFTAHPKRAALCVTYTERSLPVSDALSSPVRELRRWLSRAVPCPGPLCHS
jgi:alkanesulfonate monooxygenase SsuD/methylene tetrahydromethanopterin reductase-like flavin-dependent oxidoreductase (luciferase family)